MKEFNGQYRQPGLIDNKVNPIFQKLQRQIDPFREDLDGKRIRALRLANLFRKMADPSLEFLEDACRTISGLDHKKANTLFKSIYYANDNTEEYFSQQGIHVDNSENIHEGIRNTTILISTFEESRDHLEPGTKFNIKSLAESIFEEIQFRKSETQLDMARIELQNEPDIKKRHQKGLALKDRIIRTVGSHNVKFYFGHNFKDPVEPNWDVLKDVSTGEVSVHFEKKDGSVIAGRFGIDKAVETVQASFDRFELEKKLEKLPIRDKDRFDQLRLKYGAKGANLIILKELEPAINELGLDFKLVVPEFQLIPTDIYRKWNKGEPIVDDLRPYFNWAISSSPTDYILRSSAVYSEDGEKVTGAGIYLSKRIHSGSIFGLFKHEVENIFKSTNSSQAIAYRKEYGIDDEEMGIVVQRFVVPRGTFAFEKPTIGYINSKLSGVPELMEIRTTHSRNFVNRENLDFFLPINAKNKDVARKVNHFPPDRSMVDPLLPIRAGMIASVIEKIWQKDVQIEFVSEKSTINCVQVRDLPQSAVGESKKIIFPEEKPIYEGTSIGVGDINLPILGYQDNNSGKKGITIFSKNHEFSISGRPSSFPKEGAVIILDRAGSDSHIQTLAAEKGLICVFPDTGGKIKTEINDRELKELKKARVVSNGIEARVYKSKDEEDSSKSD